MTIKISTVFVFLIVPAAFAQIGHVGYDYRAPTVPFNMPSNLRPNINVQQAYYNNPHQLQHGVVPSPIYHQHYTDDVYRNQQLQTQQAPQYNYQGYQNAQSSYQIDNYNEYTQNFGNGNLLEAQNAQQAVQTNPNYNPSYTNNQAQQPVITKHIYFHLPPPDDTATAAQVTPSPPKKTYNIIFIKLPSQKSTSAARLQQLINLQAAAESKTLIYVLVKKPETQSIQPVTSKPEVFFVKYKEPRNVAQAVNSGSLQVPVPVLQTTTSGLLSGQVNGFGNK